MNGPMKFDAIRRAHAGDALTAWLVGHRGLFVLCRELERSLRMIERAVRAEDVIATARQLQRLSSITRACAVAFKVAGHMSKSEYDNEIVVPMTVADKSFTGLWARDHSSMLKQLRATFAQLRGFEPERAQ